MRKLGILVLGILSILNGNLGVAWAACTMPGKSLTVLEAEFNKTVPHGRGSLIQLLWSCTETSDDTGTYVIDGCPIIANVIGNCTTLEQNQTPSEVFNLNIAAGNPGQYCWCTIAFIGTDISALTPPSGYGWWNARTLGPSFTSYDACTNGCRDICVNFVRTYGDACPMLQWAMARS